MEAEADSGIRESGRVCLVFRLRAGVRTREAGLGPGPGARLRLSLVLSPLSPQSGGSDQERTKKKRRGDRYSVQTSLIVATLKKMLPIGLNMCAPTDQELIMLAKTRYALVPAQPHSGNLLGSHSAPHRAPGPC